MGTRQPPVLTADERRLVAKAKKQAAKYAKAHTELQEAQNKAIEALLARGYLTAEIGRELGVTRQRARQIVLRFRETSA